MQNTSHQAITRAKLGLGQQSKIVGVGFVDKITIEGKQKGPSD